jgi:hypothetical protein
VPAADALLSAGASLYAVNARGASPLVLAERHADVRVLLRERAGALAAEGHPQAGRAEAARVALEARLAELARTEPEQLNALLQEPGGEVRALLVRFQVDLRRCVPAAALDERSAAIVDALGADDPRAWLDQQSDEAAVTARTTHELQRIARDFEAEPEPEPEEAP